MERKENDGQYANAVNLWISYQRGAVMKNDTFWTEAIVRIILFVVGCVAAGYLFRIGWEWHG